MKKSLILLAACMMVLVGFGSTSATDCSLCGDINGDGEVNVADITAFVDWYYQNPPGPIPECPGNANMDCDDGITSRDLDYLVAYLFLGGPAPDCDCN